MGEPIRQAGAVVFRSRGGATEILLVRSRKNEYWIFPKGHVENGEKHKAAALREAREEAGIEGRIVRELEPAIEFESGSEHVRVRYFLVEHTGDVKPKESREKKWLAPLDALVHLAHEDARKLLLAAFPRSDDDAFREFLLAEYSHLADSFLHNEEDGERRVSTFLAIAGAVGAALAFGIAKDDGWNPGRRSAPIIVALIVMLVVGVLTLERVVRRNVLADQYKEQLARIRTYFVQKDDPRLRLLPFNPYAKRERHKAFSIGGGWFELLAVVDALVAGLLGAALVNTGTWLSEIAVCIVSGAATWVALNWNAQHSYRPPEAK